MDEYIKRESVYYVLTDLLGDIENDEEVSCEFASGFERALSLTEDKVKEITTADVRPERHGRWIKDSGGTIACSECGEEHEWETYRASYCDTCGAKMSWKEDTI